MHVLALDSSTRAGSVAIADADGLMVERTGDPSRPHAERLPGELLDVLRDQGLALDAVDAFAVAIGPGSFTGLRIGIATIQGLALAVGRPVVPVSTLEAIAETVADRRPGQIIAAWMDAYRRDVFSAVFRVPWDRPLSDTLSLVEAPSVEAPDRVLARWSGSGWSPDVIVGDGAVLYAALIGRAATVAVAPPLAATIARVAHARAVSGRGVHPAAVQPVYVRRPDAELAREQRDGRADAPVKG